MRIAVSGSHCSGKTTLVEAFLAKHPEYVHEPEPYEWLSELHGEMSSADFWQQLELSVERLSTYPPGSNLIAERSPLDFVAYLDALRNLGREETSSLLPAALDLAARGMNHVDLLVVLPLNDEDGIEAPESEDLDLRDAMNVCLLEILADAQARVIEIAGTERQRLAALERGGGLAHTH